MTHPARRMAPILIGVALLVGIPGYVAAFAGEVSGLVAAFSRHRGFFIGLGIYVPLHLFLVRRWTMLQVFQHELTHALFSAAFFRGVPDFRSTRNGGYIEHTGGFGGWFGDTAIGLAPYSCPTFALALALVRPLLRVQWLPWWEGAVGLTLGFHLTVAVGETARSFRVRSFERVSGGWVQSDVARRGLVFSALYIALFGLLFHGVVLSMVRHGYDGVWHFLKAGASGSWEVPGRLAAWLFPRGR